MSRKSSLGYSSYGTHSYKSGGFRSNKRKNKKKKLIMIAIAAALAVTATVCICLLAFGNKNKQEKETSSVQSSVSKTSKTESSQKTQQSSSADVSENPNIKGYYDGNVFIYNKQAYEMFYGTQDTAKQYADTISSIKKSLGNGINVYNMVVPTHTAFGVPKSYLAKTSDQKENISTIYSSYSADVKSIDVFDTMNSHKSEYVYFKTDHNWTGLGAYYAYEDFCKTAGIKAVDIKSLSSGTIKNFEGALAAATQSESNQKGYKELKSNPDSVTYYNIPGEYTCTLLENGTDKEKEVPLIANFAEGSNAYSAFIWGNNPYMKITTSQKTGKKLCIIKDSYGCAFAPFTVTNYDEVYVVDPRYYDGNVLDYIKKNKYTDVLVLSSIMTANTDVRLKELKSVLG